MGVEDEEEEEDEGIGREVWAQKKHPFSKQDRSTKLGIEGSFS